MKIKCMIALLFIFITTHSFASWFPAYPRVTILPTQITAEVINPHFTPIICNGNVWGRNLRGELLTALFVEQVLFPGQSRYAFVSTFTWAPFIDGQANIHCRFF